VNWESGVVPVRPWPRSCDSDEEGGFGFSSSEGSASRESEGDRGRVRGPVGSSGGVVARLPHCFKGGVEEGVAVGGVGC
jgi:hypothetical protein